MLWGALQSACNRYARFLDQAHFENNILPPRRRRGYNENMDADFGLERRELSIIKRLSSPVKIQYFLDCDIRYNKEVDGETCRSPRRVLRDRLAHCAEGAFFAAAALRVHGHDPLIVDLEAVRDD